MRKMFLFKMMASIIVMAALAMTQTTPVNAVLSPPGNGGASASAALVRVYTELDGKGASYTYYWLGTYTTSNGSLGLPNDSISSIVVLSPNVLVELYEHDIYDARPGKVLYVDSSTGSGVPLNLNYPILSGSVTWDNQVSAIRIKSRLPVTPTPTPTPIVSVTPTTGKPDVYYKVRYSGGGWLPEVKNTNDYAGITGRSITDVAMKASSGSIKYRVHIKGAAGFPM